MWKSIKPFRTFYRLNNHTPQFSTLPTIMAQFWNNTCNIKMNQVPLSFYWAVKSSLLIVTWIINSFLFKPFLYLILGFPHRNFNTSKVTNKYLYFIRLFFVLHSPPLAYCYSSKGTIKLIPTRLGSSYVRHDYQLVQAGFETIMLDLYSTFTCVLHTSGFFKAVFFLNYEI